MNEQQNLTGPTKQEALTDHERDELSRIVDYNKLTNILGELIKALTKRAELYEITEDIEIAKAFRVDAKVIERIYTKVRT